jgi:cellobiose-specific phosphotransferase system component IIB
MSEQKSYTEKLIEFINDSEVSQDLKAASIALVKMFRTKMSEEYKLEKEQKSTEVIDTLNYGKYKGRSIAEVSIFDKPYLRWLVKQSFVVSNPPLVTAINNALLVR